MAVTAATPLALAKVLLNDASGTNYTTAKLIPLMQKAYKELQVKMTRAGLSQSKEESTSITVPALLTQLVDGDGLLPTNFLEPIELFERGSTGEKWQLMTEQRWEPNIEQSTTLGYWVYREESIKFIGATGARLVKMRYRKKLTDITADTIPLEISDCDMWLASRTAAIAALVIGENPTRALALDADAEKLWDDLKGNRVNQRQNLPVRRRTTRYRA